MGTADRHALESAHNHIHHGTRVGAGFPFHSLRDPLVFAVDDTHNLLGRERVNAFRMGLGCSVSRCSSIANLLQLPDENDVRIPTGQRSLQRL
jgi:hypothetical protein